MQGVACPAWVPAFPAWLVALPGLLPCLVWVRPAVLCKWLPVGVPSWVLVLVDGAGVPSVLLSVLSPLPHLPGCFLWGGFSPFPPVTPFFLFPAAAVLYYIYNIIYKKNNNI